MMPSSARKSAVLLLGVLVGCSFPSSPGSRSTDTGIETVGRQFSPTGIGRSSIAATPSSAPTHTVTITPTVSPTSIGPLHTEGPYLAFIAHDSQKWKLVLLESDGTGRREWLLPDDLVESHIGEENISSDGNLFFYDTGESYADRVWSLLTLEDGEHTVLTEYDNNIAQLTPGFSPNGKWLTYYTGELSPFLPDDPPAGFFDLALNVMRIPDRIVVKKIGLLSSNYPDNFTEQWNLLMNMNEEEYHPYSMEDLMMTFTYYIDSRDWSPNGRYLAFAGEMDGPSSDLYIYDTQSGSIERLSDGLENILSIGWRSDGTEILHEGVIGLSEGGFLGHRYAANLQNGSIRTLHNKCPYDPSGRNISLGWISSHQKLSYSFDNISDASLCLYDIDTDTTMDLYPHEIDDAAIDPTSKMILLANAPFTMTESPIGLFLLNPFDGSVEEVNSEWCMSKEEDGEVHVDAVGFDSYRFMITCENETALIALDGSYALLGEKMKRATVSPDEKLLMAFSELHMNKYSLGLSLVDQQPVPHMDMTKYIWSPDSKDLFILTGDRLLDITVSDMKWATIDRGVLFGLLSWVRM